MNCDCNIAGTVLGYLPRFKFSGNLPAMVQLDGVLYYIFDPNEKLVWMNSDGIGTKSIVHSRMGTQRQGIQDLASMQGDDEGKFGGGALVSFNMIERSHFPISYSEFEDVAQDITSLIGIKMILQQEYVYDRIRDPDSNLAVYNGSGTLVSLIDEQRLENLPRPSAGDLLIAIKGNGRSNGYTDRRRLMKQWFGKDWHNTEPGKIFGQFLSTPSIIFYPAFSELISKGLATSVIHMSGGAYKDKLAKVLSKNNLYAEIGLRESDPKLFDPDPREAAFCSFFSMGDAYAKFAAGNEGFFTSPPNVSELALHCAKKHGLEAKVVAVLQKGPRRGAVLRAFNGEIVDYSF